MHARKVAVWAAVVVALVLVLWAGITTGGIKVHQRRAVTKKGEPIHVGTGNKSCPDCFVIATPETVNRIRTLIGR